MDDEALNMRRRIHERTETVQQVTEDVAATMRAGIESLHTLARTLQEAAENSRNALSELARRSAGEMSQEISQGFNFGEGDTQKLAEEVSHNFRSVAQSSTALAHAFQDVSREWLLQSRKRLQRNIDGLSALSRCRSMTEYLAVQSSLVLDNLEQSVESSRRLAELAIHMADEVSKTLAGPVEENTVEVERTNKRTSRVA